MPDQMSLIVSDERVVLGEDQLAEAVSGWARYTEGVRGILPRPYDLLHNHEAALAADAVSAGAHLDTLSLTSLQQAFCKGMIELTTSGLADNVSHLDMLRLYMLGGADFANFGILRSMQGLNGFDIVERHEVISSWYERMQEHSGVY